MGGGFENARGVAKCRLQNVRPDDRSELGKLAAADLRFYFDQALECFGFDCLLFGGDWPVATLATDYQRWLETVQELFFIRHGD